MTEDVVATHADERNAGMHGFQEFSTRGEGGAMMSACVAHEQRAFNSNLDQCNERIFVDVISSTGSERTTRRENFDHDVIDMQCIATSRDGDRNVSTPRFV